MKKVFLAIGKYLADWRNWVVHGLVGVALLVAIIWVPVAWWIKLIVLAVVVVLNSVRMVLSSKKKKRLAAENQEPSAQALETDPVEKLPAQKQATKAPQSENKQ